MIYLIYKITNLLDNKVYIGAHATTDINDGYMGSGKYLKRAIVKYGIDNFKKEILFVFSNKNKMFAKEAEIVTEDFITTANTYNIKPGGSGGNPGIIGAFSGKKHSEKSKEKIRQSALKQITTESKRKKCSSNNWAKKNPEAFRKHVRQINLGKTISAEQKQKLSLAQKNKKLVNNGITAKWADPEDMINLLTHGWVLGKIKKIIPV